MDKEEVGHICNVILLSHKKEWNNAICSYMDGPRDYYTKWTTTRLNSSHMLVKYCSKFFKPALSNMWTMIFQMFKLVLEKAEEPETKLPTSDGSSKKQESSRKTSISALLTMPKPLTVWTTINCRTFWNRWEYQTTWSASWETCMQVRKQQLELDMEQQTGSK